MEKIKKCDGQIQCPNDEDEAFKDCKSTFPKKANSKCNATSDDSTKSVEFIAIRNDCVKGGLISEKKKSL